MAVVSGNGTTKNATVSSGGIEIVASGAIASGTHVLGGGQIVDDGGTITGAVVGSGGVEDIAAGVNVSGLIVGTGATLIVLSGGTASATILSGGTEIVSSGGIVGGIVTFAVHSELSVGATKGIALTVSKFVATDTLDLAAFRFTAGEKLSLVENKAKTQGVLTVTDGTLSAQVTLFGQYVVGGFHLASDKAAGTVITYATLPAQHIELAGSHS